MKRTLKVRVGTAKAALDRFEATWKKVARRDKDATKRFGTLAARLAEAYAAVPEEEGMAEIRRAAAAKRTKPQATGKRRKG